ncbi:MAG: P-loop NTPase [Alphaproteobacteria bacterium]
MTVMRPDDVLAVLSRISPDGGGGDIVTMGWVKGVVVQGDQMGFVLDVPHHHAPQLPDLKIRAEGALKEAYPAITPRVVTTTHTAPKGGAPQKTISHGTAGPIVLPQIARILAVGSGKGGVGKSTVALGIARALQGQGQRVGLLDLDIFGPSLPTLLGALPPPPLTPEKAMIPHTIDGLTVQSIGYMVDPNKAVIWRGPMVMGAVEQLFRDTAWPALDTLVLDLPPGTGDVQLTLAQKVSLSGAILVTTPHDLAMADARRAAAMFQKMQVPVLGMIVNMAFFLCPTCDTPHDVFPAGGGDGLDIPLLGRLPLDPHGDALGPLFTDIAQTIQRFSN